MLDQLVESKSNAQENTRRSGFLLVTLVIMVSTLLGSWMYSLFAKDYGMGAGDLELSTLVAPVPVPEAEPPPPPEVKPEVKKAMPEADVRKEIIKNIMESPSQVTKIETQKPTIPERRLNVLTVKGDQNVSAQNAVPDTYKGPVQATTGIGGGGGTGGLDTGGDEPPPEIKPKPTPTPVPKVISKGVVNGNAISLPKPPYPPAAKAVRAAGAVNVQVTIDEDGNVISANAVSGHPLLRGVAEQAARSAKFTPTKLSGQAVKVTGVIIYNFVP